MKLAFKFFLLIPLLTLLTLFSFSEKVHADCVAERWEVWPPPGSIIPPNAKVLVEVYGGFKLKIYNLLNSTPQLVFGKKNIKLYSYPEFGFLLTQVLFTPTSRLPSSTQVTLKWNENQFLSEINPQDRYWKVGSKEDHTPPYWQGVPKIKEIHHDIFGCGPARYALVELPVVDENKWVRVFTEVTSLQDPKFKQSFFLIPKSESNLVVVGHGMCSGAFHLNPGETYQVKFTAFDIAGNKRHAPGEPLTILIPVQ